MRARFISRFCWLLVLAASGLGACQRAGYPTGNSAAAAYEQRPLPPAADSQLTALVVATRPCVPARRALPVPVRPRLANKPAQASQAKQLKQLLMPHLRVAKARKTVMQQARYKLSPPDEPVRYRSRAIAIILALLTFPFGLHNFYLGYYGRGALAIILTIAGSYLLLLGFLGSIFSGTGLVGLGLVGLAILIGCSAWQFSDLVRIITDDLRPKQGEYR